MFTGWGLRTISDLDESYHLLGYHRGTFWPYDTAFAACASASDYAGNRTVARRPPASRGVRVRVPSWAWMMLFAIARPSPTPAWSARMRLPPR